MVEQAPAERGEKGGMSGAVGRISRSRWPLVLSATWLILIVALGVGADVLPIAEPNELLSEARRPPSWSLDEPLGTDSLGRSQLSRVIYGARTSLVVAVLASAIGMAGGLVLGLVAGYFGGRADRVISFVLDTLLAFPPLILLLALASVMRPSLTNLVVGLSLIAVPGFGRVARANTLLYSQREFVDAARILGARNRYIVLRELLPNVLTPVAVLGFLALATLIVAEGSLSFLGLGIPPPNPSWGAMIAAGRSGLETDPHLVFVPASMLFLTVLALNAFADRVRSRVDIRGSTL